tara:strand:- start:1953 stop:2168 length:216 start_codon:yes stop_codon:yes gene_type:complete
MAKIKAKGTCVGSVPFWISDKIGIESFNKIQAGETADVELSHLETQVLEFVEIVEEKKSSSSSSSSSEGDE